MAACWRTRPYMYGSRPVRSGRRVRAVAMGAVRSVVATLVSTHTKPRGAISYQPPGHPSLETASVLAWTTPPARRYPIMGLWRLLARGSSLPRPALRRARATAGRSRPPNRRRDPRRRLRAQSQARGALAAALERASCTQRPPQGQARWRAGPTGDAIAMRIEGESEAAVSPSRAHGHGGEVPAKALIAVMRDSIVAPAPAVAYDSVTLTFPLSRA